MKNTVLILALVTTSIAAMMLTGCQSAAQKSEDAQADVQNAQENLNEEEAAAAVAAQEAAKEQEWMAFKSDIEVKIKDNETKISELKGKMKSAGKAMDSAYANKIEKLDEKNKALKTRMDNYSSNPDDWESFKREFNHDMDELGKAFKDLTVDNKQ